MPIPAGECRGFDAFEQHFGKHPPGIRGYDSEYLIIGNGDNDGPCGTL